MPATGKLVLILGPSGVGKSVIINTLREKHPEFVFPPSVTTRKPRPGEVEGKIYHFVSDIEFDRMIQDDELLEWAIVHQGPRYGTLKREILGGIEEGKTVVREVDVQGFKSIRSLPIFDPRKGTYRLHSIFILPGSEEELENRIRSRAPISEEELKKRLLDIRMECAYAESANHQIRNPDGKLEETIAAVEKAIQE
jgi:guanylate kinase